MLERTRFSVWTTFVGFSLLLPAACRSGHEGADPFHQLADPEPGVRVEAVKRLAQSDDPRAQSALMRALADPEFDVQRSAAGILGRRDDDALIEQLITGLKSDELQRRSGCVLALAQSADPRVFDALAEQCRRGNLAFRWQVAEAIGRARNRSMIPRMLTSVHKGDDWQVQEVAVLALAEMHEAVGIEPLLQALKSNNNYIRKIACWKLSLIGDPQALEPLIDDVLKKYDTYETRIWGALAINSITKEASGVGASLMAREPEKFLQWWKQNRHRYE